MRPCAYPLWIAAVHLLHVPLRPAIELLQIGGALVLLIALRRIGTKRWIGASCFAAICFHPAGFQLNNYTCPTPFTRLPCMCARRFDSYGRDTTHVGCRWNGGMIAILWNTREEGLLVAAMVAIWSATTFRPGKKPWPPNAPGAGANHKTDRYHLRRGRAGDYRGLHDKLLRLPIFRAVRNDGAQLSSVVSRSPAHSATRAKGIRAHYDRHVAPRFQRGRTFAQLRPQFLMNRSVRRGAPKPIVASGFPTKLGWAGSSGQRVTLPASPASLTPPEESKRFFKNAAREINIACDDGRFADTVVVDGFLSSVSAKRRIEQAACLPRARRRQVLRALAEKHDRR